MSDIAVTFRQATPDDAAFIAAVMLEAVGTGLMEQGLTPNEQTVEICRQTGTLYSYRNAVIAMVDGKPAGGLISYDGNGYHDIKNHTFELIKSELSFNPFDMDDETRAGEYYIDCVAVLPQFRGKGLGRKIIEYAVGQASALGLPAVIACLPDNVPAYALYSGMGFETHGTMHVFGEDYLRMVLE